MVCFPEKMVIEDDWIVHMIPIEEYKIKVKIISIEKAIPRIIDSEIEEQC